MKDTVIIYHSPCLDGFGGAYAAWKKFGDSATYLPMRRSSLTIEGLAGKDVYFIDFTYPQELTDQVVTQARSVTILDHHAAVQDVVKSAPTHVFDDDHSGAVIAWNYFHPDQPLPRLFRYLEDIDLYRKALPHGKEVAAYLSIQPFEFARWEKLVSEFEGDTTFSDILKTGANFVQYNEAVVAELARDAFLVEFEGYKVMAANAPGIFRSAVANKLATEHPPFALTWHAEPLKVHYSLRGTGEVDLAKLAQKFDGNGHHNAAGFVLPFDAPLPFKIV